MEKSTPHLNAVQHSNCKTEGASSPSSGGPCGVSGTGRNSSDMKTRKGVDSEPGQCLFWTLALLADSQSKQVNPGMTLRKGLAGQSPTPTVCVSVRRIYQGYPCRYFETLKGIQLRNVQEGMCYFWMPTTSLHKEGLFANVGHHDEASVTVCHCGRPWRQVFGNLISLADLNGSIWSHMHFLP